MGARGSIRAITRATWSFPDLAVNPEDRTLSVVNASSVHRVCYVTVYDHPVLDRDGVAFPSGRAVDDDGHERACVTFILLLPPRVILHAATLSEPTSEIDSDVQDWSRHPDPEDTHPAPLGSPLGGDGPWLCTQGEGGALTHFFSGNLHAVDFRCDVGTDILAVADGEVLEVSQSRSLTGVAVSNLYAWNSVMMRCDVDGGDLIVEYVHVKKRQRGGQGGGHGATRTKSVRERGGGIQPGAPPAFHRVSNQRRGRGDVSRSVRSRRRGEEHASEPYVPVAGKWYDARGERPTPGTEARGRMRRCGVARAHRCVVVTRDGGASQSVVFARSRRRLRLPASTPPYPRLAPSSVLELAEKVGPRERDAETHGGGAGDDHLERDEAGGESSGMEYTAAEPAAARDEAEGGDGAGRGAVVDERLTLGEETGLLDVGEGDGVGDAEETELLRGGDRLADESELGSLANHLGLLPLGRGANLRGMRERRVRGVGA